MSLKKQKLDREILIKAPTWILLLSTGGFFFFFGEGWNRGPSSLANEE
jgi:hypothetical protein